MKSDMLGFIFPFLHEIASELCFNTTAKNIYRNNYK